ncbi:MAG TPA: 16S rRNA (uracil(1498)-N(3))-methyltransferase [Steroidobacteraceae bacterium]|jgi:16S rRNA (uracil1498-N3)-methyltransferase
MRVTRVYVGSPLSAGRRQQVEGSAANHIARVLRLAAGDRLTLFDGRGGEYAGAIQEIGRDFVSIDVREHHPLERESPVQLILAQGISRGERMDWVVQKATELGVFRIVPLLTERSVVQLDARQAQKKLQHWRAIAIAACEQSGRTRVPEIVEPLSLGSFLRSADQGSRLLLWPGAERGLGELASPGQSLTVLIGPEGGLGSEERNAAQAAGFLPVRLGPRVLRTETAAVTALAVLQQRFGDL